MKKSYRFTLVVAMFAALLFGGANNACPQNYVEIGNGTDETVFFPVMAHLANSASQQLYLASDIGSTPMEINAIAFHHKPYSSTTAAATRSVKVYLTATSERYITQQGGWLSVPGTGILCRINLNDASLTHIGNTGRNASYGWTMAFDRETGELFWPQIGEALDDYGLYKVNTQTGSTSLLGKIGEGGIISLGGLFGIESSGVAIQSADATTEVSVFPNPMSGVVNVTAAGLQRVEVMDITGRTVAVSTSQTIDISAQPNGIYMLRIVTDGGTTVRKVVKQ